MEVLFIIGAAILGFCFPEWLLILGNRGELKIFHNILVSLGTALIAAYIAFGV